jgi:hypothetical protein
MTDRCAGGGLSCAIPKKRLNGLARLSVSFNRMISIGLEPGSRLIG